MGENSYSEILPSEGSKICRKPTCSKDGEPQPLSEFYHHPRTSDGHRPECKSCSNRYRADWARKRYVPLIGRRRVRSPERKLEMERAQAARDERVTRLHTTGANAFRVTLLQAGLKVCSKCREEKSLSEFNRQINSPGGRRSACRKCQRQAQARDRQIAKKQELAPSLLFEMS
jgi:hypothetical protein